jgi:UDP-N-acetylglucosamine pyrophosphorylase
MNTDRRMAVVIMAAGRGTRMNNPDMAKVMYPINGRPMIEYVVHLAAGLRASVIVVVVGWQKDSVVDHLMRLPFRVSCVDQIPQLGTGHAVMQAEQALREFEGDVLILSGDVPLLSQATVAQLLESHRRTGADVTVLTAILDDPTGYGRILRGEDGLMTGIVEQKDATEKELAIQEINSGIYVFDKAKLFEALEHITPENKQNEYYLTDTLRYFWVRHWNVKAMLAKDPIEIQGINTPEQLEEARGIMAGRIRVD